ncbi:hypothetical protein NQ317_009738 [Molorchus minor]|uniref:Methyltransferase domain-containing protein n=1 Tax=Molorchus minor TaxID=1323400 RepID=A0ABQ9IQX8_9CUCU|nr:hypothetical protein NQ317_009738 [Molorchus minor]
MVLEKDQRYTQCALSAEFYQVENAISFLGYLSHLLNVCYQYTVVGIDCSSEKIALAYKNQDKYFSICKDNVKFVELSIDENSAEKIKLLKQEYFQEMNDKSRCCIVGLHACADLSITVLELFDKLNFVNCLVIMPCCYHMIDLEKSVNEREYFKRFPSSKLFKQMWKQLDAESYIKRTFLRLACQQTAQSFVNMSKEEHDKHSRSCIFRATLQEVAESGKANKVFQPDLNNFSLVFNQFAINHE